MDTLVMDQLAEVTAKRVRKEYNDEVSRQLFGQRIEFKGMKWSERGHNWMDYTITVAGIKENVSGNPVYSEVTVIDERGEIYTILSTSPIKFL